MYVEEITTDFQMSNEFDYFIEFNCDYINLLSDKFKTLVKIGSIFNQFKICDKNHILIKDKLSLEEMFKKIKNIFLMYNDLKIITLYCNENKRCLIFKANDSYYKFEESLLKRNELYKYVNETLLYDELINIQEKRNDKEFAVFNDNNMAYTINSLHPPFIYRYDINNKKCYLFKQYPYFLEMIKKFVIENNIDNFYYINDGICFNYKVISALNTFDIKRDCDNTFIDIPKKLYYIPEKKYMKVNQFGWLSQFKKTLKH